MTVQANRSATDLHRALDNVPELKERWSRSVDMADFYCPSYSDYDRQATEAGQDPLRIAVRQAASGPSIILPFTALPHQHSFTIAERRLGRMNARALQLANPSLADGHAPADIAQILAHVLKTERLDLINLGEIPEHSTLRKALDHLPATARCLRLGRKESVRWLIDLPESFEAYLKAMPRKQRKNLTWQQRRAEKSFDLQVETFTEPGTIDRFLEEGEKISRRTYQWNVGQQLRNDSATRDHFNALAGQGRLRCHLLLLDGVPRAFSRGVMQGKVYLDDTPGYDPDFATYSVGTILLLKAIQDLIENTDCRVFDFGVGGDWTGYKSRFGNRAFACNSYYVVHATRPRALSILIGEKGLSGLKNLAAAIVPDGPIRENIRRRLRKFGD